MPVSRGLRALRFCCKGLIRVLSNLKVFVFRAVECVKGFQGSFNRFKVFEGLRIFKRTFSRVSKRFFRVFEGGVRV